ncbi:MAG: two component transcriptional regulator, winged helix family [Geobacteraceae bacterium]|nr:two component transcriptional regulator, winged helix family [Geobacteraceae bacterium]
MHGELYKYGYENTSVYKYLPEPRTPQTGSIQQTFGQAYMIDEMQAHLSKLQALVRGKEVQHNPTSYELLRLLVIHASKIITHSQILRQVRDMAYIDQPHLLQVNISSLHRKIEDDASSLSAIS